MHLVIVGGGMAGMSALTSIAKKTSKNISDLRITVIDPKDYLEVRWAAVRAMFDSKINDSIVVPYSKIISPYISFVTHISAAVTSINTQDRRVILSTNEMIDQYDVCLLATGSMTSQKILTPQHSNNESQTEPETVAARRADLLAYGEKLLSASHVLVNGGGPIGCELAGDIVGFSKENNKELQVTLVQSKQQLIPDFGLKASEMVYKKLQKLGVSIKLSTKAYKTNEEGTTWDLKDSMNPKDKLGDLSVDMAFNATGVQSCIPSTFFTDLEDTVDNEGWILTDDYGIIKGTNNRVFALGDCVKGNPKSGVEAMGNRDIMGDNITRVLLALQDKSDPGRLSSFKDLNKEFNENPKAQGIITVGPSSGVAVMPFGTTRVLLPFIKNKTMFVFKVKSDIGWH